MTSEEFISHFPACPVCKTAVVNIEKEEGPTCSFLAGCSRRCLTLNFNGKFIRFEPENDRAMVYNTEDSTIQVAQVEFPYDKEELGKVSFSKMQEKVLTYKTPRYVYSLLGRYFDSDL
jgi:hypothetical protein